MPLAVAFCVAVFWGAFAWWGATAFGVPDKWLVGVCAWAFVLAVCLPAVSLAMARGKMEER